MQVSILVLFFYFPVSATDRAHSAKVQRRKHAAGQAGTGAHCLRLVAVALGRAVVRRICLDRTGGTCSRSVQRASSLIARPARWEQSVLVYTASST
jgi:hypothetical protein